MLPVVRQIVAETKQRPQVLVRDLPISGRPTILGWIKRRWKCPACTRSFTEMHPQMPPRSRMTLRYKSHLADRATAEGNFAGVARSEGICYDTVSRSFRTRAELVRAQRPRPAPKVLSIDEASFKKGHDYNTIISGPLDHYVLDTVRGRDGIGLAAGLFSLGEDVLKESKR